MDFNKAEINVVFNEPERASVILQHELALMAALDVVEVLNPDDLPVMQTNNQILPVSLKRRNVPRVQIKLDHARFIQRNLPNWNRFYGPIQFTSNCCHHALTS